MNRLLCVLSLLSPTLAACAGGEVTDARASSSVTLPDATGTRVEVATLNASDARLTLELPAELIGESDARLATPAGGFVDAVLVGAGERVARGQVLARVDAASNAQRLEIAEAQAAQARAELERARSLGDGVSRSALLAAETQARVAEANLELARINATRSSIRAPFAGRVAEVLVEAGEVVAPGAPVLRLVRPDPIVAELSVTDRDIVHLREGQEVNLRVQSLSGVYPGVVRNRGVAADAATRTWTVEVEVPNADEALMPGMLGRVSLERQVADEAIVIPQDWVVTQLNESGVFVEEGGRARWRVVRLGTFVEDSVVVEEGLAAGERVVMAGHRGLAEGDELLVVRAGQCCEAGRVRW